jgi:hypothetical protein
VRAQLERRGQRVVVPKLVDNSSPEPPYWRQHVDAVASALHAVPADQPLVLAGHSGAGPLLPAIGAAVGHNVAAYVFVDAGIPRDGWSRLQLMDAEDSAFADRFRQHLAAGGRFPEWSDAQLAPFIPDDAARRAVIAELCPRAAAFFEEPIPVPAAWPDARCGYLQFSAAYDVPAGEARGRGWPVRRIDGGHFQMLVDPQAVAAAFVALAESDG